jgi:serine/threonine protein phosphatase PrpC
MTDPLDDEAIQAIVAATPLDLLANTLTDEALKAGSEDNVTVVVVGAV